MNTDPEAPLLPLKAAGDHPVRRFRGWCAYDGTDFLGWQSQRGGNTIQDLLEARLATLFARPVRIHGSGRTDSGVHALGQVFHFDAAWPHPLDRLQQALRNGFPDSIRVWKLEESPPKFHARYDATGKRYIYRLCEGWANPFETRWCWSLGSRCLDVDRMNTAALHLLGQHDFTAFGAAASEPGEEDPVKTLWKLEVEREGSRLKLVTEGSGYLYKMVRSLTGALVDVGLGKLSVDDIRRILESRLRTNAVVTAPARGLCLEEVFYGERVGKDR